MEIEKSSTLKGQANEFSQKPSETLFGIRSPEIPIDDESYPTVWLMTDEEYQQIQNRMGGGE